MALNGLIILLVLLLTVVMTLFLAVILSPKFRGFAVGLMLLLLFGGFALVLIGYFVSYRRASFTYQHAAHMNVPRSRSNFRPMRPHETVVMPTDATVIHHPSEGMVEFIHRDKTVAEVSAINDFDAEVLVSAEEGELTGQEGAETPAAADTTSPAELNELVADDSDEAVIQAGIEDNEIARVQQAAGGPAESAVEQAATEESVTEEAMTEETAIVEEVVVAERPAAGEIESTDATEDVRSSEPRDVDEERDSNPTISATRPTWVTSPPLAVDGDPAMVVVSDRFVTRAECEQDLKQQIHSQVLRYALENSRRSSGLKMFPFSDGDIREITRDRYIDEVSTSVGPMIQIHQLIVFDEKFDRGVRDRIHRATVGQRLGQAGVMSGGILLLLTTVFGLLKISAYTQRARTG